MAQHYPIDLEKETAVKKSVARIGKYIARSFWLRSRKNFEKDSVYTKDIMSLSDDYKTEKDDFVVTISPYSLKDKIWDERKEGGSDFRKNACLECHFDKQGNINAVYYPL